MIQLKINEALMEAVTYARVEEVKACLENGADPNYYQPVEIDRAPEYSQPTTPLRMVVFRISDNLLNEQGLKDFAEIARLLLHNGADPKPAIELAELRYGKLDPENRYDGDLMVEVYRIILEGSNKD